VASGSDVVLLEATDNYNFGDKALVWDSEYNYEAVDVVEDTNGLTADITGDYDNARVMPLWKGETPDGLSVSRAPLSINATVSFMLSESSDLSLSTYAQYRGHDVIPDCPIVGGGSFSDDTGYELSTFDNVVGDNLYLRRRTDVEYTFQTRWHKFTPSEVYELRQWIHSRQGRQKAFWIPTYAKDLTPASSISGTTVTVYNDILSRSTFDIEIVASGTSYYRQVTSTSAGSEINGRPTVDLTINSSVTESLGDISRISYLVCSRFDSDRAEFEHSARGGSVLQMPCREIPVP